MRRMPKPRPNKGEELWLSAGAQPSLADPGVGSEGRDRD